MKTTVTSSTSSVRRGATSAEPLTTTARIPSTPLDPLPGSLRSVTMTDSAIMPLRALLKVNPQAIQEADNESSGGISFQHKDVPFSIQQHEDGQVTLAQDLKLRRLVLGGGGAKGVVFPGAIKALEEQGQMAHIRDVD